jgi:2-methylisocitrate lyase-like PEP mutase family enzyme
MSNQTQALRSLIASGKPFIAADCYSALTGRIVEQAGFPAAYMGGHATGMMHYAVPDNGVLTTTEMIDQAGRVAEAISIPLVVDADQLGESVADVHRSVRRYEKAGVAGIHMEDELTPKHSTFDGPLMPVADMQARISAAADARRDKDFILIARCDEFYEVGGGGSGSLEEAIRRGVAYGEAGADAFLPTMATPEQIAEIAKQVSIPVGCFGPIMGGCTFSLYTGWGTASAANAHQRWAAHLMQHGELPPEAYEFPNKPSYISQGEYDTIIETWAKRTGRPTRTLDA